MLGVRQALLRAEARADQLPHRLRRGPRGDRHRSQPRRRSVHARRRRPKARGSRTSPRRTSTPTSCPAAASWRRAPARRCYLSDEGGAGLEVRVRGRSGTSCRIKHGDRIDVGNVLIDAIHTPGHTPEHLTFLVTDRAGANEPIARGDRRLHLRRRRRPSRSARARRATSRGRWRRARGRCTGACRRSARGRTGCRSGRDTARDRRAARASARFRRARSATSSASTGRSRRESEDEFVRERARRSAGAAEVLRRDEAREQGRPAACSADFRRPIALDAGMLLDAPRATARSSIDTRRATEFATGHVPGTINIPLNSAASRPGRAGSCRTTRTSTCIVDERRRGAVDAVVRDLAMIGLDRVGGLLRRRRARRVGRSPGRPLGDDSADRVAAICAESLEHGGVTLIDVRNDGRMGRRATSTARVTSRSATSPIGSREIPREKPIVVQCQSGARSAIAREPAARARIRSRHQLSPAACPTGSKHGLRGRRPMAKERTTPEAAAAAFGVGKIVRHLFVCAGPDCATPSRATRRGRTSSSG